MDEQNKHTPPVVLVVEDETLLRWHAVGVLEDHGFAVVQACDTPSALKVMQERPDVRVLFTDIQMPGPLDGIELARQVHERWPNVLLVITSGRARPAKAEIPDDGGFLAKPYRDPDLIFEVDRQLRKSE